VTTVTSSLSNPSSEGSTPSNSLYEKAPIEEVPFSVTRYMKGEGFTSWCMWKGIIGKPFLYLSVYLKGILIKILGTVAPYGCIVWFKLSTTWKWREDFLSFIIRASCESMWMEYRKGYPFSQNDIQKGSTPGGPLRIRLQRVGPPGGLLYWEATVLATGWSLFFYMSVMPNTTHKEKNEPWTSHDPYRNASFYSFMSQPWCYRIIY